MPKINLTSQELKVFWYAAESVLHSEEGMKDFLDHIDEPLQTAPSDLRSVATRMYAEFDSARTAEVDGGKRYQRGGARR